MTDKEQVEDAHRLWEQLTYHLDPENLEARWWSYPVDPQDKTDEELKESLLKWLPEAHMNDHTSGFIIQHRAIFDKWYNELKEAYEYFLKLNTQNDTSTTHSVT